MVLLLTEGDGVKGVPAMAAGSMIAGGTPMASSAITGAGEASAWSLARVMKCEGYLELVIPQVKSFGLWRPLENVL
ncbi:uncharacterized [Tachysurus ichikawai]